jgi:hypothetical protein
MTEYVALDGAVWSWSAIERSDGNFDLSMKELPVGSFDYPEGVYCTRPKPSLEASRAAD